MDPRVYLAIDNCFASKRWTRPSQWMQIIREIGLTGVEASADTECDPLYMGKSFTRDWIRDVRAQCEITGCVIQNVYSGHGTYATSGLSHYDRRVAERFRDHWMKAQMDTARALGAGFGFFAHGFDESLLRDDALYEAKLQRLYADLADLARYADEIRLSAVAIEQMYSPHQPPWTLSDLARLLREVYRLAGVPFYATLDLGHMNGQQYFALPGEGQILDWIDQSRRGQAPRRMWIGSAGARAIFREASAGKIAPKEAASRILEDVSRHPHLFSRPADWQIGEWIGRFGCYAPIMHLQQTDGKSSPHWPFSPEFNAKGIVKPEDVFAALGRAYAQPEDPAMPPKCEKIVMTLEPFIGTAGNAYDLIDDLKISVDCWRGWIPRDGMKLSEILRDHMPGT